MAPRKRSLTGAALAACLLLLVLTSIGCQMAAPLALTSTSMGVAYYYMNMTEKTCVYDLETMNKASLLSLKRMGFAVSDQSKDEDGNRKIKAKTEEMEITVKLKKITPKCTKIKVTVSKNVFVRDKATSSEIILQTEKTAELMKVR